MIKGACIGHKKRPITLRKVGAYIIMFCCLLVGYDVLVLALGLTINAVKNTVLLSLTRFP